MAPLDRIDLAAVQQALKVRGLDGWLIYDFHGVNPVASRVVGIGGLGSRRLFVLLPAVGAPVAVAHRIELQPLDGFPGEIRPYAAWQELHEQLGRTVRGRKLALEISPQDEVPYLDRVPMGVVQLLERLGATVESSADLVTLFSAGWSAQELADHRYAAEALASIARETLAAVVRQAGSAREHAVQQHVCERMRAAGLTWDHPPIVGFGANAANPHYEPAEGTDALLEPNQVVLLDLWGGRSLTTVFADQTWMGFSGGVVPDEVQKVWTIVRDARDAAIGRLRKGLAAGEVVTGAMLDAAARGHIAAHGYGEYFVHRTGHSIDINLHGSGPHLDSFETNDVRALLPGVGFSVEPGVYLTGRFGMRSEVNVVLGRNGGVEVTPADVQGSLILGG
jgi:Xaa-Pro aminopeptidase